MEFAWYGPEPRRYVEPVEIVETADDAQVPRALRRVEEALAQGYSIAGYLAYEAGRACVGLAAGDGAEPLLALGIYRGPRPLAAARPSAVPARLGPLVARIARDRYARDLARVADALHAGDAYQINYTVAFDFAFAGDVPALAAALLARARVIYGAVVRHGARTIVSLSPELFFAVDDRHVTVKPMKGTSEPDARASLADAKNRAEHVMIVDLLRNDLHRVCDGVGVRALFEVERYPTFATMTSTIAGNLTPGRGFADLVAALFPCGSVTGAPKRRAMETIATLEGEPRGIAMGTLGYCDAPRRGTWSVAIRTADLDEASGRGTVRIGGGIVADSDVASEWAEVLVKRRAFADVARRVGLIETMRVRADGDVRDLDAHLDRLERSAFALGIPCDARAAADTVARARAATRASDAILRLELANDGTFSLVERALDAAPPDARVIVVDVGLRSGDPALRHKTTAREAYDAAAARARAARCFDGLLLNERGEIADGARTTPFVRDDAGTLATPPLGAGALAGVLRARFLATGRAYEAVLHPADLVGREVYVGSAVRGLIRVRVVGGPGKAAYRPPWPEAVPS